MDDTDDLDPALAAAIAAAEAAIAGMADEYAVRLAQEAEALAGAAARLAASVPGDAGHRAALADAFRIAHDVKGQAGSFGLAAATHLSDAVCEALRGRAEAPEAVVAGVGRAARLLGEIATGMDPALDTQAAALAADLAPFAYGCP